MRECTRLVPPVDLIKKKESVVIVSNRKPPCVYVRRVLSILEKTILIPTEGKKNEVRRTELELTGCGAAVNRCEQITRYVKQQLLSKYKHFVKHVVVSKSRTNDICVTDYSNPSCNDEENAFDLERKERIIDRISVMIVVEY